MALEELVVWRTWNPWSIFGFISFLYFSGWNSSSIDILGGAIMFNAFSLSVVGDMYLCITSAL